MDLFGAVHEWGWAFWHRSATYATMMRLGTVIPYLKKLRKVYHVTHSLSFADISIFSSAISNFCYIEKSRY